MKEIVIPVELENGDTKYSVGVKIGNREPVLIGRNGEPLIFDTEDQAKEYIKEDC